jgi:hypothetical protein
MAIDLVLMASVAVIIVAVGANMLWEKLKAYIDKEIHQHAFMFRTLEPEPKPKPWPWQRPICFQPKPIALRYRSISDGVVGSCSKLGVEVHAKDLDTCRKRLHIGVKEHTDKLLLNGSYEERILFPKEGHRG